MVFDTHIAHQDSDNHFSNTRYDESVKRSASSLNTPDNSGLDCQHCCHCHSAQHVFLPVLIKAQSGAGHSPVRQKLIPPPTDGYWRSVLRPPIA